MYLYIYTVKNSIRVSVQNCLQTHDLDYVSNLDHDIYSLQHYTFGPKYEIYYTKPKIFSEPVLSISD